MPYQDFTSEDLASERWVPVYRYERSYSVSTLGRVRRTGANSGARLGRIISACNQSAGYLAANLWQDNIGCPWLIHRLVLESFVRPMESGEEGNHRDGDKHNNRLTNLEIVTRQGNVDHAIANGLTDGRGEANPMAVLTQAQVDEIRRRYVRGGHRCGGPGYKALAYEYGVNWSTIRNVVKGNRWTHGSA